jgi:hypothetical protein
LPSVGTPSDFGSTPEQQNQGNEGAVPAGAVSQESSAASSPIEADVQLIVVYRPSDTHGPLRQAEVLSDVFQYRRSFLSLRAKTHELEEIQHPYAIVMSPDCDLEQDFGSRMGKIKADKTISDILLLQAITVDELRATTPAGKDIWKRIRQNKDDRYHVIESADPQEDAIGAGLPALGIDFKRYFTVPLDELYEQCANQTKRRCFLDSPYSEHLNRRFSDFLSRVALPREHRVD